MKSQEMECSVSPGRPFGGLGVPDSLRIKDVHASIGTLTAIRTVVPPELEGRHGSIALFVPGFTGSKEDFYPLFPHLSSMGWEVWAYSQRGQADSVSPEGLFSYALDEVAGDVLEVAGIIARETGRTSVHLVGHSYGGLVSQAAVLLAHGRNGLQRGDWSFASLTLMCSGPHGWPGRHIDIVRRLHDGPQDLWSSEHPTITQADIDSLSPEERFMRLRSIATSRDELVAAALQLASVHDPSFDLCEVDIPKLIFHGQDDNAWPQEWQRRQARILGARYEVIPDAGHLPNIQNPVATARLLDRFWTGCEG